MKRYLVLAGAIVALITVAFVLGIQGVAGRGRDDPHRVPMVSTHQAQQEVLRVLSVTRGTESSDESIQFIGTDKFMGVSTFSFTGPDFRAEVDVSDGHVAYLDLPVPTGGTYVVTPSQALSIAKDYLRSVGSPTVGLEASVATGTGSGTSSYRVQFSRTKAGVVLPDSRMVEVDGATGKVFGFMDFRRSYSDPGSPTISQGRAGSIAVSQLPQAGSVVSSTLAVVWDTSGVQRLVWVVSVKPSDVGAPNQTVTVDASSGAILGPSDLVGP
jgi:hypothetical protein